MKVLKLAVLVAALAGSVPAATPILAAPMNNPCLTAAAAFAKQFGPRGSPEWQAAFESYLEFCESGPPPGLPCPVCDPFSYCPCP